jgi:hypothetical protein
MLPDDSPSSGSDLVPIPPVRPLQLGKAAIKRTVADLADYKKRVTAGTYYERK